MISCSWSEEEIVRGTVRELNHQSDRHLLNMLELGAKVGLCAHVHSFHTH